MTSTRMTTTGTTTNEMTASRFPRISFWRTIVAVIFAAGMYSMYARFALGFQSATNLTDPQPWVYGSAWGRFAASAYQPAVLPLRQQSIFWPGALPPHPPHLGAHLLSRIQHRLRRHAVRTRHPLENLASHRDVEPPLRVV